MKHTRLFLAVTVAALALQLTAQTNGLVWKCSRFASISNNIATIDVPPEHAKEGGSVRTAFDLSPYNGKRIRGIIRAQGTNISKPTDPWNGLKFMFHFTDAQGGSPQWLNTGSRLGSFDAQDITVTLNLATHAAHNTELTLGLQDSSGKVTFDLSTLRFEEIPPLAPITNQTYRINYSERVRNTPTLRGVMLPEANTKEDDIKTLGDWGATLARFQIMRNWHLRNSERDLDEYARWINSRLDNLEQVLGWAKTYGVRIVVDLHTPPGGRNDEGDMNMFYEQPYADAFIATWQRIATRFKGNAQIFGYDLINEPCQKHNTPYDYWNLQRRAAEAVRAIDPAAVIIIESNDWDSPSAFRELSPLAMDNVIYQAHMYFPHQYTHQGVHEPDSAINNRLTYPGKHNGETWDAAYLRRVLEPVRQFQLKHNARIYIGEFSAITWAPGAERYLADCINIFEDYGWDWSYHAFREWNGWSVEHQGNTKETLVPSADNPRKQTLLNAFKKGKR